jgi:hypothetical protein
MTPEQVLTEVRRLIQDTDATRYRYTDTALLGHMNQVIKRMCHVRPDLFTVYEDIPTQAGRSLQSLPDGAVRLVEIFHVKGGNTIAETIRETLDETYPGWHSATPGVPENFVRHIRSPDKYFLSPPPASGTIIVGEYIASPPNYTLKQQIELADVYFPIIVDGTVWLAESIDNEHVNSGRAELYKKTFYEGLGVTLDSRNISDPESGGMTASG